MSKGPITQYDIARDGLTKLFTIQAALIVLITSILLFSSVKAAYSALLGGMTCLLPSLYFAYRAFKYKGAQAAKKIMASFYTGEALKMVFTFSLFALVFIFIEIAVVPFFLTFILVQLVLWLSLFVFN